MKPLSGSYSLLLGFIFVFLSLSGCKDQNKGGQNLNSLNPEFSNYISAFTSGVISRTEPLVVRFTNTAVGEGKVGQEAAQNLLQISPSIQGTATWEDDRTLRFVPNAPLPSGTDYSVSISLEKLYPGIASDLKKFTFPVRTREQFFSVDMAGLATPDPSDLSKQEYRGSINTSDFAENSAVEKLLTVSQKGNNSIKIAWEHSQDQRRHDFIISPILRGDQASKVLIDWNGRPMGINKKGSKEMEIPKLGDFKIMQAEVVQDNEQYINLHFSDPILKTQNMDGLISIKGYTGQLRFVVDGNQVRVYPSTRLQGSREIIVTEAIKNTQNYKMQDKSNWFITFEDVKPQVRLVGKGVIIPSSEGLIFPFESVNLNAVDVEIFKIYSNNIVQFLQVNQLEGEYQLARVGKVIMQKKIALKDLNPEASYHQWERYALDLSGLVEKDPEAIYQVRLGFKKSYSTYYCSVEVNDEGILDDYYRESDYEDDEIESFYDYGYRYWNYDGYRWDHRDDPCYPPYYMSHNFVARNVVASDLGIITKRGEDGTINSAVANLISAQPVPNTKLAFYDYQQQMIGEVTTDAVGMASIKLDRKPFVLIARNGTSRGYLKMDDGASLSLSRFDVSGTKPQKGLKGYIYGERGVWRPGDSIYLNFILEDKNRSLPKGHPINLEFYDARGNLKTKRLAQTNDYQMYPFFLTTDEEDPTGNWQVKVKVGGAVFSKTIKVETVKPNRLKIKIDFGVEELVADSDLKGKVQVNWLHGAPAQNLRTKIEYMLNTVNTAFPKYSDFEFDDPARSYNSTPQVLFEGDVDNTGSASFSADLNTNKSVPGKMKVNFSSRVFEKGGDFSTDNFTIDYSPYRSYAGINIPKNKWGSKRFDIDQDNEFEMVLVDKDGKALSNKSLSIGFYKVEWRWWWERGVENVTAYNSTSHFGSISKGNVTTSSNGTAKFSVKPDDWGRYLIRVCDDESGHCTGDYFYAGSPWYDDENDDRKAATMLAFNSNKPSYLVGETVELSIPSSGQGKALISIENGSRVVESYWTDLTEGETSFRFYATEEMTPTVYAHVSLIQPHAQTENDMPIRMYGIIPLNVENPDTRLDPVLKMDDVLKPEAKFTVEVSEKNKKGMSYTLAVVDEGLLDLTRFSTPDPWKSFYAREALGVKTWDVYDQVLGAYGGQLERILSIGGDGEEGPKGNQKANRFKPVVRHLGPFYLKPGQKVKHEIDMPNYVGSVRTMVVASNSEGAYGKTDKTTPVRNPLMVLATLPRVLGPTETLVLPVNVFAMENKVKNVEVKVEVNDKLEISGPASKSISFDNIGDQMVYFNLRVKEGLGIAKVKVLVSGNGEKANQEIELDVRNPNPVVTNVLNAVLQPGENWETTFSPVGMSGTNSGILEVSSFPSIDLGRRLNYLIRYPHGCIEQTTSAAFPQLYLSKVVEMDPEKIKKSEDNVRAALNRLRFFQTAGGGFGYWPGDQQSSDWGSVYAGHFMLEAKAKGYTLPPNILEAWKQAEKKNARNWTPFTDKNNYYRYRNDALTQAYRLYALALAGSPELGAMNRLRERPNLPKTAKWRLAASYALAGKKDIAKVLVNDIDTKVEAYQELGYSYGSALRDRGMILETLLLLDNKTTAAEVAFDVAKELGSNSWYSTQTLAYSLVAVGKFLGDNDTRKELSFAYSLGDEAVQNSGANKPVVQLPISIDNSTIRSANVKNSGQGVLYARVILQGQPVVGDSTSSSSKLKMTVNYFDMAGKKIDPMGIEQGTDFVAEVTVQNPGNFGYYQEMALSQIFPSGWELRNTRMDNIDFAAGGNRAEYQDIRDDRIYSYFDIGTGQSQTYRIQLNAAYQGRFYLPTTTCEAMYDNTINARKAGQWVRVLAPAGLQ